MTKKHQPPIEDDFDEKELFSHAMFDNQKTMFSGPKHHQSPAKTENPLAKYFRYAGVHIKLPTEGKFLPPDSIKTSMNGEVAVNAMCASDEFMLKNPDALFSGLAIEKLIESCVPGILINPRMLSMPDIDVLLLAIRAASYGNKMDIEIICPECKHENTFECDIPTLLESVKEITDDECCIRLSQELIAYIRPFNLENSTKLSLSSFNEMRKMQEADINEIPDAQKSKLLDESYNIMAALDVELISDCIIQIVTPEETVSDKKFIYEFIKNASINMIKAIKDGLANLNKKGVDKSIKAVCTECEHTWDTFLEFDQASFFDSRS